MQRVDAVGNSPGVHRELAEGIGSLLGLRKKIRQMKTETCQKIVGGSRKACRDERRVYHCRPGFQAVEPPRWVNGSYPDFLDMVRFWLRF
ncbi:hypothetical protein GW17_00025492 [Ensete ventricosum]|nr:hypothetical protein GW17_00025492 [Ensete ventricosum]